MMSIKEAVAQNIIYLRQPHWANKRDHLELTIAGGRLLPWIKLWAEDAENPTQILAVTLDLTKQEYEPWVQP